MDVDRDVAGNSVFWDSLAVGPRFPLGLGLSLDSKLCRVSHVESRAWLVLESVRLFGDPGLFRTAPLRVLQQEPL